jgi:hypothetical protein
MGLVGWDLSASIANGHTTARSALVYAAWHRPTAAFIVGLLDGHFFAPSVVRPPSQAASAVLVLACAAVLIWLEYTTSAPRWCIPALPFVDGVVAGCFVWTREDPLNWRDL